MALETVTFALEGDVSLEQFSSGVQHFAGLMKALSNDADAANLRWAVVGLEVSSAIATVEAVRENGYRVDQVEQVVRSYLEVGEALAAGETIPFPPPVQKEARALAGILQMGVRSIRFETAEADAIIEEAPARPPTSEASADYGAVTGRVQSLSSRAGLRFTLFDLLHDRAVSCYLAEGNEDLMRGVWDMVATVEGLVSRDRVTGRPIAVRQITDVSVVRDEGEPDGYRRARGAQLRVAGDPAAEERIRRLRDAQ
jgi:hypothetical protein